jgi:hypothetical protein
MQTDATTPLTDALLAVSDAELDRSWRTLQAWMQQRFGFESVGVEGLLFLAGVQENGTGYDPGMEKEAKQATIMDGTYAVLAHAGLYERAGVETDGRPIWARLEAPPELGIDDQERLLRTALVRYFTDVLPPGAFGEISSR